MKRTASIDTEGAKLVFDLQGAGEPLLMISGAGGDATAYDALAKLLSDQFTVITYDRRCNGRSSGEQNADLDMAQQARDAIAVLRAAGYERAAVFGNSGGANIALQLAAEAPTHVRRLLLHEPPAVGLLDDGGETLAFVRRVHAAFKSDGVPAAMRIFASRLVGFDFSRGPPNGLGHQKNMSFFFGHEYLPITLARPDLASIRAAGVPSAVLAGEKSEDAYYVRTARKVAEGLGCPLTLVPGNHLAFLGEPSAFAEALRKVLTAS